MYPKKDEYISAHLGRPINPQEVVAWVENGRRVCAAFGLDTPVKWLIQQVRQILRDEDHIKSRWRRRAFRRSCREAKAAWANAHPTEVWWAYGEFPRYYAAGYRLYADGELCAWEKGGKFSHVGKGVVFNPLEPEPPTELLPREKPSWRQAIEAASLRNLTT